MKYLTFLLCAIFAFTACKTRSETVAAYYFPNWGTADSSEWALLKKAPPRFEGHRQPKVPAWGYLNENDPASERIITVNSWNEWGEGSYLEPDTIYGLKYLEAVRDVFGQN